MTDRTETKIFLTILLAVSLIAMGCASSGGDDDDTNDTSTVNPDDWHPAYPVDNFEDGDDAIMEGTGDWITYADTENGASISPDDDITSGVQDGGVSESKAMHITGNIGEGSSYGTGLEAYFEMDGGEFVARDFAAKGNEGLVVWAKGNCKLRACINMKQLVPTEYGGSCDEEADPDCWVFHCTETDEVLTDKWTLFEMPFTDFEQSGGSTALDLASIVSIQFTQDSETCPDSEFDIWVDNVGIYGGDEWKEVWALFETEE